LEKGGAVAIRTTQDGKTWTAPQRTGFLAIYGPAIARAPRDGGLDLAFVQPAPPKQADNSIWVSSSANGAQWGPQSERPEAKASAAPALIGSDAGLTLCVYKGFGNNNLAYSYSKQMVFMG
jgi:hypothetical protein